MVLIGVLGGLALPSLRGAVESADATKVVTDMAVVRQAVLTYREDRSELPRTARWGTVPAELQPYLDAVDFTYKDLEYRLQVNERRGRADFGVRYPRDSRIGAALQRYRRPGREAGSVTWSARQTVFRLLEDDR
jgi:type II secretory pathway pseudopilin PulG